MAPHLGENLRWNGEGPEMVPVEVQLGDRSSEGLTTKAADALIFIGSPARRLYCT